jgi:hypothetical protein
VDKAVNLPEWTVDVSSRGLWEYRNILESSIVFHAHSVLIDVGHCAPRLGEEETYYGAQGHNHVLPFMGRAAVIWYQLGVGEL